MKLKSFSLLQIGIIAILLPVLTANGGVPTTAPTTAQSGDGSTQISLPAGWLQSHRGKIRAEVIEATTLNVSLEVWGESKAEFPDIDLPTYARNAIDVHRGSEEITDGPRKLEVNGWRAIQYTTQAKTNATVFVRTFVESPKQYIRIVFATDELTLKQNQKEIDSIILSLRTFEARHRARRSSVPQRQ